METSYAKKDSDLMTNENRATSTKPGLSAVLGWSAILLSAVLAFISLSMAENTGLKVLFAAAGTVLVVALVTKIWGWRKANK